MSEPAIVVFDIDGVLADFTYGFTALHEGRARSQGTARQWQFEGRVDPTWDLIDRSRHFWYELPVLATRQEREEMWALRRRAEIVYLTRRSDKLGNDTLGQTRNWLTENGFPHGNLILAADKTPILKGYGDNLVGIIDDKPDLLVEMLKARLPAYIRDWEYNRWTGVADLHLMAGPRVSSVGEFVWLMERKLDAR